VGPAPPLKLIMLAGMRKVRSSECECRLASTLECPSACGLARGRASCDCCSSFFSLVECRVPRFLRSYKSLSIGLELLMIASTGSRLLIIYSPPLPFQPQHRSSNFTSFFQLYHRAFPCYFDINQGSKASKPLRNNYKLTAIKNGATWRLKES
jgi:hypothetical protein